MKCDICQLAIEPLKLLNHFFRHKKQDLASLLVNKFYKSKNEPPIIKSGPNTPNQMGNPNVCQLIAKDKASNTTYVGGCNNVTPKRSVRKRRRTLKAETYEKSLREMNAEKKLFSENESELSSFSVDLEHGERNIDFNNVKIEDIQIQKIYEGVEKLENSDTCSVETTSCNSPQQEICEKCGGPFSLYNDLFSFNTDNHKMCFGCNFSSHESVPKEEFYYTEVKYYVCHYCSKEYVSRDSLKEHLDIHLENSVLNDVVSLEKDYLNEYRAMNTFYNFYNAGFHFGKRSQQTEFDSIEFYNFFLNYATNLNLYRLDNFGYYCDQCQFSYFNLNIFQNHIQYFHLVDF